MLPHKAIEARLQAAVSSVLSGADTAGVLVRPCPDPKFGDYQSNALMALAKERRLNPRQLAADVPTAKLDVSEWCGPVEIAGAGFLNFRLKPSVLADTLAVAARGEHLFFQKAGHPRTAVVDFSSPNVAKPMHVGHIRSTILGDSLARTLRLLGHHVVTDNHIGDWGTQFGKLLVGWKTRLDHAALQADPIGEMERLYKTINAESESDPAVLEQARQELVKLQSGDEENLRIWREMIALSEAPVRQHLPAPRRQNSTTPTAKVFTNPLLKGVVRELLNKQIARESEGAICVFSDGSLPPKQDPFLKQEDGEWKANPCLIQKSDGAANYATTDLATLPAYRLETWHPGEILYVTDGRQQLHFQQIFRHPSAAGIRKHEHQTLAHVWFGSILGEDGKPFKTRSGETVKLAELLDEAGERALRVVTEKNPDLPEAQQKEIARVVGLGSIKYADLSQNRQSDYVFSWDKMLALNRKHRAVFAICLRPHPQHLPQGWRGNQHPDSPLRPH